MNRRSLEIFGATARGETGRSTWPRRSTVMPAARARRLARDDPHHQGSTAEPERYEAHHPLGGARIGPVGPSAAAT